jgi:REP element-mobilizing transposase RayT
VLRTSPLDQPPSVRKGEARSLNKRGRTETCQKYELPPPKPRSGHGSGFSGGLSAAQPGHSDPVIDGFGAVLWSRSYRVLSCGGAPLDVIRQYIHQQERPKD